MWQIAKRFMPSLPTKPAPSKHSEVSDLFRHDFVAVLYNFPRNAFGSCAGWAHSILFCAELPQFQKGEES